MSTHRDNWEELANRIEGLGLKLKLHLQQEQSETAAAADAAKDTADTAAAGAEEPIIDSFSKLGDMLDDAFESMANATRDEGVRSDVKDIGSLLKDAVGTTIASVSGELNGLKDAFMRPKVTDDVVDVVEGELESPQDS